MPTCNELYWQVFIDFVLHISPILGIGHHIFLNIVDSTK